MMENSKAQVQVEAQEFYEGKLAQTKMNLICELRNALGSIQTTAGENYRSAVSDTIRHISAISEFDGRIPKMLSGECPIFKIEKRTSEKVTITPVYLRNRKVIEAKEDAALKTVEKVQVYETASAI